MPFVPMDIEEAFKASDESVCKQQLKQSRDLYLEELHKQQTLTMANAALTE